MKFLSLISFALLLSSCSKKSEEWKKHWSKHEKDFKHVVTLMDSNALQITPAGTTYIIPDHIQLQYPCSQTVMKLNDHSLDSGNSYLFFLDTAQRDIRENPVLVYTNNRLRIKFYENFFKENVEKIETNWYFLYD